MALPVTDQDVYKTLMHPYDLATQGMNPCVAATQLQLCHPLAQARTTFLPGFTGNLVDVHLGQGSQRCYSRGAHRCDGTGAAASTVNAWNTSSLLANCKPHV